LAYQRFNTLNSGYLKDVLDGWVSGGCMPEIRRRLGYRFRLVHSSARVQGTQLHLEITVHNDGFANLYNPRPLFLVCRNRASGKLERFPVGDDPRYWMPGEDSGFHISVKLPPGEYELLIHLPDAAPQLRDRPEYAVCFANPDVREPATGMNRLAEVAVVRK